MGSEETQTEKPIEQREIAQRDLTGKVAVTKGTATKRYDIFTVLGFQMKMDADAPLKLKERDEAFSGQHTGKESEQWRETQVFNKTKAVPFKTHKDKDLNTLVSGMNGWIFDDGDLPEDIKQTHQQIDYVSWETPKYVVKIKKALYENKSAKFTKTISKKPSRRDPQKWINRARVDINEFVAKKMRLKKGVFSTEGEFAAYQKALVDVMFANLPIILDEHQTTLQDVKA